MNPAPGPPRGILRFEPGAGKFRHERRPPSERLAAWVEHYWFVAWDLGDGPPQQRQTLPHPSVHLVVERGRSRILGPSTRRFTRVLEGSGQVFGIKFRPAGFQPFVGASMAGLRERSLPLGAVFGAAGERYEQAVLDSGDDVERMMSCAERLLEAGLPAADPMVERVNQWVYASMADRSITRVEQLSERCKLTLRGLQRLFAQYVGLSPKWVIQRYRLHEAIERLATGSPPDWAALALELGYFDQAHFIRDFRRMTGWAPLAYLQRGG